MLPPTEFPGGLDHETRSKAMNMKKIRRICLIVIGIWVSIGTIAAAGLFVTGEWRLFHDDKIEQLFTCNGPDPLTGLPTQPVVTFPDDTVQLHTCGYLETSSPVRLSFLLFYEDEFIGRFVWGKKFEQGFFFEPISFQGDGHPKPGLYRIEVHRGRNRRGSTEFVVTTSK
jgi:hypothetical protein